jgi:hypothetical protein
MLLKNRLDLSLLVTDHANFIGISNTDPLRISYLTKERYDKVIAETPEGEDPNFWKTSKRYSCKPGVFVKKMFKDFSDKEIELFSNLYKSFVNKKEFEFKVVSGEKIKEYYSGNLHQTNKGSLGASCMRYDGCQSFFALYTKNPEVVSMLVMLSPENLVLGRALLWNLPEFKIMDRIYTVDDERYTPQIKQWAEQNGYFYKTKQSWNSTLQFSNGKIEKELQLSVKLTNFDFRLYPYLDTFKWLDCGTGIIYNYLPDHFYGNSRFRCITLPNGGFEKYNHLGFCEILRMYYNRNDIVNVDGINVHASNVVTSETLNKHLLKRDAFYSEELHDYIYSDDSRNDKEKIELRKAYLIERELRNKSRRTKSHYIDSIIGRVNYEPWTVVAAEPIDNTDMVGTEPTLEPTTTVASNGSTRENGDVVADITDQIRESIETFYYDFVPRRRLRVREEETNTVQVNGDQETDLEY